MSSEPTRIAFVCVRNAGRSQMATAYAERELAERGLDEAVEIRSGGTRSADEVHPIVVEAMREDGFDLADRVPRGISADELAPCDYVATMGCSTLDLDAETDVRDWDLADPRGKAYDTVREIRERVNGRVNALFDEIEECDPNRRGNTRVSEAFCVSRPYGRP